MAEQFPRYYLHGDEAEDAPATYYCKRCDVFWPREHFATQCRGEEHLSIYHRHFANVRASAKHVKVNRPARASSVFDKF